MRGQRRANPPEKSANIDAGCPAGQYRGLTCTLHCEYGYEFGGNPHAIATYKCDQSGRWVPENGAGFGCTGRPCDQTTLPLGASGAGGTVGPTGLHQDDTTKIGSINSYKYPSTVEFECNAKQSGLKQHVAGEAGWVCSNETFTCTMERTTKGRKRRT